MKTLAAVLVETGRPLELAELTVPALRPGQAVILSWLKGSGHDVPGTTYDWDGRTVNAGGVTTFSRHAVVSENRLTVVPEGLDLVAAALLGCAVPTGLGAVLNTAAARPGQSLAVFGAGGIGLCAVQGAALSGCAPVIAVDVRPDKLALARALGATHTVDAGAGDAVAAVKAICPAGVDLAVEASGRPAVMQQALLSVRAQGGAAVVIGNAHAGEQIALDPRQLNQGKRLLGTWGGDSQPDRDTPRYAALIAAGRFDPAPLVSPPYSLDDINQALADLEAGAVVRPLIAMASS